MFDSVIGSSMPAQSIYCAWLLETAARHAVRQPYMLDMQAHLVVLVLRPRGLLAVPSRQGSPAVPWCLQDGGRQRCVVPPGDKHRRPLGGSRAALRAVAPAAAGLRAVLRRVLQACLHTCC